MKTITTILKLRFPIKQLGDYRQYPYGKFSERNRYIPDLSTPLGRLEYLKLRNARKVA